MIDVSTWKAKKNPIGPAPRGMARAEHELRALLKADQSLRRLVGAAKTASGAFSRQDREDH